jgi:CheY-like chemotaxis protein
VDLVITDIFMPRHEGIETIKQIRKISALPIIAMSGVPAMEGTHLADSFDPLIAAQQLGADMAIRKPFTSDALIAAVDEMLRTVPHASGQR